MNYSYIPQKYVEYQPVYSNNQPCPRCRSNATYPLMNMVGSSRICDKCKCTFEPQIIRYETVVVEK